jgi:peroxiredoxin
MYGKPVTGVERTTFVIAPGTGPAAKPVQRLLHVFAKVTPARHAEQVFALLKSSAIAGKK